MALEQQTKSSFPVVDHIRWISAFLVLFSHARNMLMVDYSGLSEPSLASAVFYGLSGMGHIAVVIFFVLSGFLVGGKVLKDCAKGTSLVDVKRFIFDRFTRIYVVLIPALGLSLAILLVCACWLKEAPILNREEWCAGWRASVKSDLAWQPWLSNLFLVNALTGRELGINGVLWSLSYEWIYYIFGGCVLALATKRVSLTIFSASVATALFGGLLVLNPDVLIGAIAWLFGMLAAAGHRRGSLTRPANWYFGWIVLFGLMLASRVVKLPDLLIAASLAFLLAHQRIRSPWAGKFAAYFASFSFSLYIIHAPVLIATIALLQKVGYVRERLHFCGTSVLVCFALVCLGIVAARSFASVTEGRLNFWRNKLAGGPVRKGT